MIHLLKPDLSPRGQNRFVAQVGFTLRGQDISLFEETQFDTLELDKNDIVVAGVGYVHKAFARLGFTFEHLPSIPQKLKPYAGRRQWTSTLAQARQQATDGTPVFIKPVPHNPKQFTGHVLSVFRDFLATAHLPDDTPVECADVVSLVSEYRGFVLDNTLIDLRRYAGNPLAMPNPTFIEHALAAWTQKPAACSMDFGVTASGETLLVEVNDAYALGNYGLPATLYAQMIETRWAQIRQY